METRKHGGVEKSGRVAVTVEQLNAVMKALVVNDSLHCMHIAFFEYPPPSMQ